MMYRNFFICLFLVFTYGCSDSNNDDGFDLSPVDPPANPVTTANANQPGWLYVQTEATAQMTSDTTLEIPFTREVFGFADRPDRRSAYFTASEFEAFWSEEGANSFTEDPPNAVLTWLNGEEQREAEVIINNATVYSDGVQESLVYEVTVETGKMPDAQMSSVSLFVDSSSEAATSGVKVCSAEGKCVTVSNSYDFAQAIIGDDRTQGGYVQFPMWIKPPVGGVSPCDLTADYLTIFWPVSLTFCWYPAESGTP